MDPPAAAHNQPKHDKMAAQSLHIRAICIDVLGCAWMLLHGSAVKRDTKQQSISSIDISRLETIDTLIQIGGGGGSFLMVVLFNRGSDFIGLFER